jgi:hypothetical protein
MSWKGLFREPVAGLTGSPLIPAGHINSYADYPHGVNEAEIIVPHSHIEQTPDMEMSRWVDMPKPDNLPIVLPFVAPISHKVRKLKEGAKALLDKIAMGEGLKIIKDNEMFKKKAKEKNTLFDNRTRGAA